MIGIERERGYGPPKPEKSATFLAAATSGGRFWDWSRGDQARRVAEAKDAILLGSGWIAEKFPAQLVAAKAAYAAEIAAWEAANSAAQLAQPSTASAPVRFDRDGNIVGDEY
jgi:hypothetical protein